MKTWNIMPYESLGEFLAELQDSRELVRIAAPVDSALEIAAITDRVANTFPDGGPALFFENVRNSTIPVVTNLLGSRRRLCRCLGIDDLGELSVALDQRTQSDPSGGWLDAFKLVPGWNQLGKWAPRIVKTAASQQVVRMGRDVNLWDLPVPRSWPHESNPVITSGQMVMRHPQTGETYVYHSPLVVTGPQELGWYDSLPQQTRLWTMAVQAKQNLPVSISLGGNPVLNLISVFPRLIDAPSVCGNVEWNESRTDPLPYE